MDTGEKSGITDYVNTKFKDIYIKKNITNIITLFGVGISPWQFKKQNIVCFLCNLGQKQFIFSSLVWLDKKKVISDYYYPNRITRNLYSISIFSYIARKRSSLLLNTEQMEFLM